MRLRIRLNMANLHSTWNGKGVWNEKSGLKLANKIGYQLVIVKCQDWNFKNTQRRLNSLQRKVRPKRDGKVVKNVGLM